MQYMGSKSKIAKHLLPHMLESQKPNRLWVEPFVGGCNMIDKVTGKRWGNDNNPYLIEMWKALQKGWIPPSEVSRDTYYEVKKNQNKSDPALVGFVGFLCSFGGKWFGGYAENKKKRNYAESGKRNLLKQIENLRDVEFTCLNYWEMSLEPNCIIYCDPPYRGTTEYATRFDHDRFWEWCRSMSKEGHKVFISEYTAPEDFVCIKTIEHQTVLNRNKKSSRIEKFFTFERP